MILTGEEGYVFRHRYPEREIIYRCFADRSSEARGALPCRTDVAYGAHPRQRFDLFPGTPGGPVLIFIHGGYWRSQAKESFSFVARPFVEQGYSVGIVGYPLLPDVSFSTLCESVRRGTAAVLATIGEMGLRPRFWALCGHSAGGHLAALLASMDWPRHGPPRGCLAVSGIFDLEPLLATSLGGMLGLDNAAATAFSPLRIDHCRGRLLAAVGSAETDAFEAQSRAYAAHWSAQGGDARFIQLKHRHHYDILCDLMQSRSELVDHFQTFVAPD
jgi:arylformamidase